MKIKIGCDIVQIDRFSKLENKVLEKIFSEKEFKNSKSESLAGIFAVKESVKKVFDDLNWHDIEVKKEKSGKPTLLLLRHNNEIESCDISISHDGAYAFATAVFILKIE